MTANQIISAIQLDHYKDRTGDYTASRIPVFTDFIKPVVSTPVNLRKWPASIRKYGLSRQAYWSLQDKQNNRCAICGAQPNGRALHVDHCHASNKMRGLICHGCNLAIGFIKEDSGTARAIADYLDKHNENASVGTANASTLQKYNVDLS